MMSMLFVALVAAQPMPAQAAPAQPDPAVLPPSIPANQPGKEHGGRTFLSPMGEPFRGSGDNAARWFAAADANKDGHITRAEFAADAVRFFTALDTDHDGEIGPDEITRYETEIAPEVATGGFGGSFGQSGSKGGRGPGGGHRGGGAGGGGRGGFGGEGATRSTDSGGSSGQPSPPIAQGAARFSYFDMPEPVIAADTDFNRGVSRTEFEQAAFGRFQQLDANGDGVLEASELPRLEQSRGGRTRPHRKQHHNDEQGD